MNTMAPGIEINPGDVVIVHGAPTQVPFGEKVAMQCRATVIRAGWFDRLATGRSIDINAFGISQVEAFSRLLPPRVQTSSLAGRTQ